MSSEKPHAMRIGESAFCAGYLVFAFVAGLVFVAHGEGDASGFALTCAAMTFLLGAGDAFHLVPRILINLRGDARNVREKQWREFWLGLGNLVSSVTMTVFYVLLFDAMGRMPSAPAMPEHGQVLRIVLVCLTVVRIVLCLFPQNRWFDGVGDQRWGIYRNLPFVAMGALSVYYLVAWYGAHLLAGLVTVSFACYLGVVLFARRRPALGMLMIPKTICYIWMIAFFL